MAPAGGLGESTIPLTEGVVEGCDRVSSGTEFVVGICEAVGVVLYWLPFTLLGGIGLPTGNAGLIGAAAVAGCGLLAG